MSLKLRELGVTGLKISELGYGCGGVWGLSLVAEKDAINYVHKAAEWGVSFFDTGSSYCGGNAEMRLGKALSSLNRSALIIGTKAGTQIGPGGKLYKDYSAEAINKNIEESLRRLKTDYVDILQFHSPRLSDLNDDVWESLEKIKESGKARFIGISADGDVLQKAIDSNRLDVIMTTFNVVNRVNQAAIEQAGKMGLGVLIKSPMAHSTYNSELFKITSLRKLWYFLRVMKNYRSIFFGARKLSFMNEVEGVSPHNIALKFVLQQTGVSCAVMGTTNIAHLKNNIEGMTQDVPGEILTRIQQTAFA